MTEEQRKQAFLEGYNELVKELGFQLVSQVYYEQMGTALLTRPQLSVVPIEGWQPVSQTIAGNLIKSND